MRRAGLPFERVNSGDPLDAALSATQRAVATVFQRHAQSRPTLEACCRRMKARYFA